MALILYWIKPWFQKGSLVQKCIVSILVCEAFEIIVSLIGMPDFLYRLLPIRYFFLIYLGYLWVERGIVINSKTIVLSLLSMLAIIYFSYFYVPTEPWFYDTAWYTHRWPCYFYVSTLLCYILYCLYKKLYHYEIVQKATRILARCSYEIFMLQMAVIALFPSMDFIENGILRTVVKITLIFIFSIVGGYYYNIIYNALLRKYKL
jgi:hypothetical protein